MCEILSTYQLTNRSSEKQPFDLSNLNNPVYIGELWLPNTVAIGDTDVSFLDINPGYWYMYKTDHGLLMTQTLDLNTSDWKDTSGVGVDTGTIIILRGDVAKLLVDDTNNIDRDDYNEGYVYKGNIPIGYKIDTYVGDGGYGIWQSGNQSMFIELD